jgi:hypothetical protein
MKRAHIRDAARTQKFHFRKYIAPPPDCTPSQSLSTAAPSTPQKPMTNTEREIADAIAAEVRSSPPCGRCSPCGAKVGNLLFPVHPLYSL